MAEHIGLRKFNNVLSVVVIVLSVYILLVPWLPKLGYWWGKHFGKEPALVAANDDNVQNKPEEVVPQQNTLVIPSMHAQWEIFDGPDLGTLNKGIWHLPYTSSPDQNGNTVIVGHRFTYTDPSGPFYNLDQVKEGDKIVVYWNKQKYVYKVDKVSVVPPTALEVERQTDTKLLTLYTCTPLWSARDRLVVQAKPVEASP